MLRWDFKKPIGEIIWRDYKGNEYETKVYKGNAFLICIREWKEEDGTDLWAINFFIVDKPHFKNICRDKDWNFAEFMARASFHELDSEIWSFCKEIHRRGVPIDIR